MFVIIVGAGRTGSLLAELLLQAGHTIKIIDDRPEVVDRLRQELPPEAIVAGRGSDPAVLEEAGIRQANVLAAVTGADEANLVATSLARFEFKVPRIIARVNDPKNAWMFIPEMGVDVVISQADIFAQLIIEEMSLGDMTTLLKLRRGRYSVVEEKLQVGSKAIGLSLQEIPLPSNCIILTVIRNGEVVIPHGSLQFEAEDEILAIVDRASLEAFKRLLT